MKVQSVEIGQKTVKRAQLRRLLTAANSNMRQRMKLKPAAAVEPGPFEIEPKGPDSGQTLITALLVFYPVAASVAAILAGLYLLGGGGGPI